MSRPGGIVWLPNGFQLLESVPFNDAMGATLISRLSRRSILLYSHGTSVHRSSA